jgi:hypothetical protein
MVKSESTEVGEKANTQVAAVNLEQYTGQGMEGAEAADFAIPYVICLQKLSPQIDTVDGAKPGYILETAGNRLFNQDGAGLQVIPCYFRKDMVEWKPRESGGGLVAAHGWNETLMQSTTKNDRGQMILPNGNILVDTKYHYVLMPTAEGLIRAVISMSSTQLKKSRKWLTMMQMRQAPKTGGGTYNPPSFAYFYNLKTVNEENDKGKWVGWAIENGPMVTDKELLVEAIKFYRSIMAGDVKLSDPDAGLKDDNIPF